MTVVGPGTEMLRFGPCEIRVAERQVLVAGRPAAIGSRAFDVLMALVQRRGGVVTRAELLDAAWHRLVVEENNISVQIAALRKALGPQAIATIPGIGYAFSAMIEEAPPPPPPSPPPTADAVDTAAAAADARRAGNVPPGVDDLIGRDADVQAVSALVRQHRLVTLTGPGGIGKTRLALAVAARWPDPPAGGIWIVEAAPVSDPALLPAAVAQTLGIRLPGLKTPLEEVVEALQDLQVLLLLDNCEHLVQAAGRLVQALLDHTRHVRVLATSQELIKLSSEHVYRLPPLAVPGAGDTAVADHAAVRLLVRRVRALDARFELQPAQGGDAAEICRRLDGLPLAIELAAARVPLLGVAGVRAALDERFGLLAGGSRTAAPRHRTLRETLAWSHALLTPDERTAFRRAGVFAGSFGLREAHQVLGGPDDDRWAVLDALGGLVDKSLVLVDATDPPRYRMLESARAYALEMLRAAGEAALVQRRHAVAMRALFDESVALRWTLPSQQRLRRCLPDLDNGRAALEWSQHDDPALHGALAGSMAWLFGAVGQAGEGLRHVQRALAGLQQAQDGVPAEVVARLHLELSALHHGSAGTAKLRAAESAVELLRGVGDHAALYTALGRLAIAAALCNDSAQGERAVAEMAALWDADWPPLARWDLLNARDYVANLMERIDEGERLAAEQLALARAHGDTGKLLFSLMAAEQCAATRGRYEEAVERGTELVALAQREDYAERLHIYIYNLATALVMCGRIDDALPLARRSAELDSRNGSLWETLDMLAMLALRRGRTAHAARILGRSDAANAWRSDGFRQPVEVRVREAVVVALQAALPEAELAALQAEGAALDDEAAAALALGGDDDAA